MGRQATLRQKGGHWASDAGGKTRRFGKVAETPYADALQRFREHLANPKPTDAPESPTPTSAFIVGDLRDKYLAWLKRNRSDKNHRESKRHLDRFANAYGTLNADAITGEHLEAFQDTLAGVHAPLYVKKHSASVRTMFNRGVRMGWLSPSFRPFATVEAIRLDPRPLSESDLPTLGEVRTLFANAKSEMADMLHVYYATGARTHELIDARVGDFQPTARTLVLGRHKRSKTLREPTPRTIMLNADAHAILARRCEGRESNAVIFPNRNGKPYTSVLLDDRFATVRRRAKVRDEITLYSFRHLWISEMLMAGVDVLLVAKMAGTSVKMIETVYGHFRTQSYADAQAKLDAARARRKA